MLSLIKTRQVVELRRHLRYDKNLLKLKLALLYSWVLLHKESYRSVPVFQWVCNMVITATSFILGIRELLLQATLNFCLLLIKMTTRFTTRGATQRNTQIVIILLNYHFCFNGN